MGKKFYVNVQVIDLEGKVVDEQTMQNAGDTHSEATDAGIGIARKLKGNKKHLTVKITVLPYMNYRPAPNVAYKNENLERKKRAERARPDYRQERDKTEFVKRGKKRK